MLRQFYLHFLKYVKQKLAIQLSQLPSSLKTLALDTIQEEKNFSKENVGFLMHKPYGQIILNANLPI